MKKQLAIVFAAALVAVAAVGCSKKTEVTTEEKSETQIANPWTEVDSADAAAEGAGVGYFTVPENRQYGEVTIYISDYHYMEGIAEADGLLGSADLKIRKGLKQNSEDISGDYNNYSVNWTFEVDGFTIRCSGNEDGKIRKAIWVSDNFSYSINVTGQGEDSDTFGPDEETIKLLVQAIQ